MLTELATQLQSYADGTLGREALEQWLDRLLAADPLGAERSESAPWDQAADESRLFWRLVYRFDTEQPGADEATERRLAGRVVRCLAATRSAADSFELLVIVEDEERFTAIVAKHLAGIISRTGFLNVVSASGYPPHVKLWLQVAAPTSLAWLRERLLAGDYGVVARALERPPPERR